MNIHISAIIVVRKRIQPCPLVLVRRSVVRRSVFITILCRLRSGEVLKAFKKNIRYFFGGRRGKLSSVASAYVTAMSSLVTTRLMRFSESTTGIICRLCRIKSWLSAA
jgi:hypothetical protein